MKAEWCLKCQTVHNLNTITTEHTQTGEEDKEIVITQTRYECSRCYTLIYSEQTEKQAG